MTTEVDFLAPLSAFVDSNGDELRMKSVLIHPPDEQNGGQNVPELISLTTITTEILATADQDTFPIIHGNIEETEMKMKTGNKLQLDNNNS